MAIGERIKIVRESEGKNQRDFAFSIKISQPTLAMFENGQREPKDIHIEQICLKYGINEKWLRTGEGEMYNMPEDKTAAVVSELLEESNPVYDAVISIVQTYQKLDEKSQKVLDNFIKEVYENFKKEG